MKEDVKLISIESIRIVNPRHRDPKKFQAIIRSIKNLGLKKPIQVSLRSAQEGDGGGYDLVAGQGRIEACLALGFKEIAAIVINASKEDRLLMSLVENMARRFSTPLDLITEIQRLKDVGHSNAAIGEKLDLGVNMVTGLLTLANKGEERLLEAAIQNKIPVGVAIDISRAEGAEAQRELLKAYEGGQLNQCSIRTLNRLIEQRRHFGKKRDLRKRTRTTADGLVNAYRRETERQAALVRKARVSEGKLIFIVTALKRLMEDENFTNLLKAEGLLTMPKCLAEKTTLEPLEV
jgi:ParB family chromosome partitioning protein